jgi:hypothetical protein
MTGLSTDYDESQYLHKMVFIGMANNPITTIHSLGITDAEIGTDLTMLCYCLETRSINNPNNVIILFPVYYKRLPLLSDERGKYLAKFQIHERLVSSLFARVNVFFEGNIKYVNHRYARIVTEEMGKPITQSIAEIDVLW